MIRNLSAAATAAALVVALSACGQGGGSAANAPGSSLPPVDPDGAAPTTSIADEARQSAPSTSLPPRRAPLPADEPNPVDVRSLENRNDPTTPLGALCWARREVVIALVQQSPEMPEERTGETGRSRIEAAATRLNDREDLSSVDASVADFADFFTEMVNQSLAEPDAKWVDDAGTVATQFFDFESYPGGADYMKAATEAPECVDP